MKTSAFIILLALTSNLTACDRSKDRADQAEADLAKAKQQLDASESAKGDALREKDETKKRIQELSSCHREFQGTLGKVVEKNVKLMRETQHVRRVDCHGKVSFDEVDTITSPRENIKLDDFPILKKYMYRAFVRNRQTCSQKGLYRPNLLGLRMTEPVLWIDQADALLTHQVQGGENMIDLGLCQDVTSDDSGVSKCPEITWIGTLKLKVDYQETKLGGIKVEEADKASCNQK